MNYLNTKLKTVIILKIVKNLRKTEASVCYALLTVSKSRNDKAIYRLTNTDKPINC